MGKQFVFSEIWTDIVQVVDRQWLLNSELQAKRYEATERLETGFYLLLRHANMRNGTTRGEDCHLVGPFQYEAAANLLKTSVLHFAGDDGPRFVRTRIGHAFDIPPAPLSEQESGAHLIFSGAAA